MGFEVHDWRGLLRAFWGAGMAVGWVACSDPPPSQFGGAYAGDLGNGSNGQADAGSGLGDDEPPRIVRADVDIRPAESIAGFVPTQAGAGARILVTLVFSEPVASGELALSAVRTDGADRLDFATTDTEPRGAGARSARFEVTVDPAVHGSGRYLPSIRLEDLSGESAQATFDDPPILLDTDGGMLVVDPSLVIYVRSPFGNAAPERLSDDGYMIPAGIARSALAPADDLDPSRSIAALAFTEVGEPVRRIRVWADADRTDRLAEVDPAPDGTWPRSAFEFVEDRPTVWLDGLDGAGNQTQVVEVEAGEYVAGSGPGPAERSPHLLFTSPVERDGFHELSQVKDRTLTASPDGDPLRRITGSAWDFREGIPGTRSGARVVFDAARNELLHFGGRSLDPNQPDGTDRLWAWDGQRWKRLAALGGAPSPRVRHAMAYDAARQVVVLFGGVDVTFASGDGFGDTWIWDGGRWTEAAVNGPSPTARNGHAMTYDPDAERVLLFGGVDAATDRNDLWAWNGSSWTEVWDGTAGGPSPRRGAAMTYADGLVWVFGGQTNGSNDLWTYDGTTWEQVSTFDPRLPGSPRRADGTALVPDPSGTGLLLFGAADDGQVMRWDGDWTTLGEQDRSGPRASDSVQAALDPGRGIVWLTNTDPRRGPNHGIWRWTDNGTERADLTGQRPSARTAPHVIHHQGRATTMVYGGEEGFGSVALDMWEYDGERWSEIELGPERPVPAGFQDAFGYDRARGVAVFVTTLGGVTSTWEWDGAWTEVDTQGPAPSGAEPTLVFDEGRNRLVMMVPNETDLRTWTWDGTTWTPDNAAGTLPPTRRSPIVVFDPLADGLFVHGGLQLARPSDGRRDTHLLQTNMWREVTDPRNGPGSEGFGYFDVQRAAVSVFSLASFAEPPGWWDWRADRWAARTVDATGVEVPFGAGPMVYDPGRERAVAIFELTTMEMVGPGTPVAHFAADVQDAPSRDRMEEIRFRAFCGGQSAGRTGATLHVYNHQDDRWLQVAETNAPLPEPANMVDPMTAILSEDVADFVARDDRIHVECRAKDGTEPGSAEVGLDYAEIRTRYAR